MRRMVLVSGFLVSCVITGVSTAQDAATGAASSLYDNFRGPFIDPQKWDGVGGLSRNTPELVREIRNGQLRLAARTYGNRWADSGGEFDFSEVDFKNPQTITSFGAWVVVTRVGGLSCANNPIITDPTVHLIGVFCATGDLGSEATDINAMIVIRPGVFSPSLTTPLTVRLSVRAWNSSGDTEYGGADLGTVRVGERIFVFVRWDRANRRFVGGMKKAETVPVIASVPYTFDDSKAPGYMYKGISVRNYTPNCQAQPTLAGIEALFDGVVVNVPWEP